ncbi:hypothetical protein MAUB_14160 [Mycolicibacterium aubagnense]|uniref:Uncharacterized protein n=1 Tax=Mycolicibacterium aubagnense TaxID=319707 RepID=A0ABN5YPF1_9MYCO|nr:hypothetical protein MAUB_14160 [Mycolicibacterium aubagnense]
MASLKSRNAPDHDPRVLAARQGLAYWRVRRSVEREAGQISPAGVDRLRADLAEAVAR